MNVLLQINQHLSCCHVAIFLKRIDEPNFFFLLLFRGGVKLEFVRNSVNSIRKFTIRLIRKGKKSSKNSINFNSKFVRFERKKFEKFANFSNSVFCFEKFEIIFLSNNILCYSIVSVGFKGTLFWNYIINLHVHLHFICGWPKSKYFTHILSIWKIRNQFDLNSIRKF